MTSLKDMHMQTQLVHAGRAREQFAGAQVTPIVRSTVFETGDSVDYHDIRYPRLSTLPNQLEVAGLVAEIEGAEAGLVTSSGMAAITTTLLGTLAGGGHLLAQRPLYGGTQAFVARELPKLGSETTFIDAREPESWASGLRPNSRAIYVEAISNPLMEVVDHTRVVAFAKQHQLISIIDNTFATPINFRPRGLGFDLVLHSATKYLNGHSDVCAGVIVGAAARIRELKVWLDLLGGTADPEACYLLRRGLKTLALRVRCQNDNALRLAEFLEGHPAVERVSYPGLPSHPDHAVARRHFDGFGGMLSLVLQGGGPAALAFARRLEVAVHSPSLGGPESLVTIPAMTSHAALSASERAATGIGDGLIRVSVGIEHIRDLLADFEQALQLA